MQQSRGVVFPHEGQQKALVWLVGMLFWHRNTTEELTAVLVLAPSIKGQECNKSCHLQGEVHEHSQSSIQSEGPHCWHGGKGPWWHKTQIIRHAFQTTNPFVNIDQKLYLKRSKQTLKGCRGACWELHVQALDQCAAPESLHPSLHLSGGQKEKVTKSDYFRVTGIVELDTGTWYSRTKMKMLSAPTASTRKGTTCKMTSEDGRPIHE